MKRPKGSRGAGSKAGRAVSAKKSSVSRKKPKSAAKPYPAERIFKAQSQHATSPNPPSTGPRNTVAIRVLSGETYSITVPPQFAGMAMYWEHVLRNRIRWAQNDDAARSVLQRSLETLGELGLDDARLGGLSVLYGTCHNFSSDVCARVNMDSIFGSSSSAAPPPNQLGLDR